MNKVLRHAAFVAGLLALLWVGIGLVESNLLGLGVTGLIAAFYLAGAIELMRYQRDTDTLGSLVSGMSDHVTDLGAWLTGVPAPLRQAVRRRVDGEPVGLAGPVVAPYIAGLLVLLGMLGTFIGMVLTLRGTGAALDSAADLLSVRASLAAPVRGLGLAFGTSIAGVAGSAALGLMSALARGERAAVARALDGRIATTLRVFSPIHQREASLELLRRQADQMPALVDSLRSVVDAMERQGRDSADRLAAGQAAFHERAGATYATLAASVEQSLRRSIDDGARIAAESIRPVVESTLAGIARETAALHATLGQAAGEQAERLSARLEAVSERVAATWGEAVVRHERVGHELSGELRTTLGEAASAFEQHAADLSRTLAESQARQQATSAADDARRAGISADALQALAASLRDEYQRAGEAALAQQSRLVEQVEAHTRGNLAEIGGLLASAAEAPRAAAEVVGALRDQLAASVARDNALLDERSRVLATMDTLLERVGTDVSGHLRSTMTEAVGAFERHAATLSRTLVEEDSRRAAASADMLQAMAAALRDEWQRSGEATIAQQARLGETLSRTVADLSSQVEAHTRGNLAEIGRLLEAAAEAPRAAAEVIGALRDKLADSMSRDNALLEERSRVLSTMDTLLGAVKQAAVEQRGAIDALVDSSTALLDRVGARFESQVEVEASRLAQVAAQADGSAAGVAQLGEAFGAAVQRFSESNETVVGQLQRIEGALDKSMARSDEQLAYYVAQAREVVDLSILSQREIIENLQRLAERTGREVDA